MAAEKKIQKKRGKFMRRKARVRARISGTSLRPRLVVFRSLKHMHAQVIDDEQGVTLAAASDKELGTAAQKLKKTAVAGEVGALIAKKAVKKGITEVVFDKSGYRYHGRVKELAEAARKGGLRF